MKIQLANNAPNHRLDCVLRGLKVNLHEYLKIIWLLDATADWLVEVCIHLHLINRVNKTRLWKVGVKILSVELVSRETPGRAITQAYADFTM